MQYSGILLNRIRGWKRSHQIPLERRRVLLEELTFLYHLCIASEQLLEDAQHQCYGLSDKFAGQLGSYYSDHRKEEEGEIWTLIEDLKVADIEVERLTPNPVACALIGTQYYLIKHVHPVSLLGYMAIQEADPTPIEFVEKLEELHGKDLLRFVRLHAERDQEHALVLLDMIDEVPEHLRIHIQFSVDNALSLYGQR